MVVYYLKLYVATLVTFLAIDMIWLGLIARRFYAKYLGFLLSAKPIWSAAILFYLLFVAGILVFVVLPGFHINSAKRVFLLGALFGLVTYGTYDLTNLALVKEWPWIVTVIDMGWGAILAAIVSYVGFMIGKFLS
ncbi:MAG: DUF2177 family protein [Sedimentisphaerales bacterium]|nr:DUF2177 family protein [Sedimentisphaerales bacterium]